LTEIRIKKISKFDIDKAKQFIESLEEKIEEVKKHLANIIEFAIDYFKNLKLKYGKGKERLTEIRLFDDIIATKVVMRNTKLYVNREEGFVGTSLKKDEYVDDCADIDDVIVFRGDGTMLVTKVDAKTFVGKDIIHVAVFKKNDTRTVYNMIYRDGKNGPSYIKRFNVTGVTRDKEYDLTAGNKGSQVLYFTENPNGEAETITVNLRAAGSVKKLKWDIDFSDLTIKGRSSRGNIVSKHAIKKIELKSEGVSTLKPRKIWFDETVQRLNVDKRGELLGEFKPEDRLLIINQKGIIKTVKPELATHFDSDMIVLEKWVPEKPISVIYYDGDKEKYFVKRFMIDNPNKEEVFISEHPKSQLEIVATEYRPMAEVQFSKRNLEPILLNFEEFIAIKGIKAQGNQLTADKIKQVNMLEPLPYEAPVIENVEVNDEEVIDNSPESFDDDSDSENDSLANEAGQIKLF
jgi:topoisomerase IV subunit A